MRLAARVVGVLVAVGVLYLGITAAQVWWASTRDGARPAGAIVVLGAAQYDGRPSPVLAARLDHALDLWRSGLAPVIVVTGGRQPGDRFTEAGAAYRYLRAAGVPDEALRLETGGHSSWESLAATVRFLRAEGIRDLLLVSDPAHAYRIADIAAELGVEAAVSPTPYLETSAATTVRSLARETLAVAAGRIIGYRRLLNLDARLHR